MHVVLKPFRYAHNGWQIEELQIGDEREFHADAIENLIREGYVGEKPQAAPAPEQTATPAAPKRGRPRKE